jgi:NADH:ubiquinone oxidoreductase subunit 4 (subunit M)
VSGFAGLLGTFLPLLVVALAASGPFRGAQLRAISLAVHLVSWACFLLVTLRFYTADAGTDFSVFSPAILTGSQWSGATALRWNFPAAAICLVACSVFVSFHFIAREMLERSRASVAGLAGYLCCLLGALGADHPLLFCVFFAGAIVPRLVLHGLDSREGRIEAVKESAFLAVIAMISLLVCVLAFAEPFRAGLGDWFKIEGRDRVVLPGGIGITLMLLAASIGAGIFPFHGNARRIFQLGELERAVPLSLQPIFGFSLLFRFGLASFPQEFREFAPVLLGLFAVGIAYCAVGFFGSKGARDRVFWLQQTFSCFVAVGFFSLSLKGWHGAEVLLFFECMAIPFFLLVLACHERRPALPSALEIGRYPAFALSTALAALFALFLPVSVGFYGVLLVTWSLVGVYYWPLPFVILSMPLIAFAGVRIMYFKLGDRASLPSGEFTDLRRDEMVAIFPLGIALLLLGLLPRILMGPMGISVSGALKAMGFTG